MQVGLFWAVAAALAAMVGLVLVQALRRGGIGAEEHPDLKVYRDQLAEVDRDLARGTLAEDEAQRLRLEVQRRLLEADRAAGHQAGVQPRSGIAVTAGVILLALAGSLALYQSLGAPGYPDLPLSARIAMAEDAYKNRPDQATAEASAPPAQTPTPSAEFTALMDKLRAAITERPDDTQGLELLARNEAALGNYVAAYTAQAHLVDVLADKATPAQRLMVAQIMVAAAGGYVSPEAEKVLMEVLQRDPKNGMARYLSGLMFAQVGRPDRAFALWEPLLAEGPENAAWIGPIRADIEGIAEEAGIKYSLPGGGKGPSMDDMQAAGEMSAEDRQAMIEGMVGQLETRLLSEGGPVEDWLKLMNALAVLGQPDRGRAALAAAEKALATDAAALEAVRAAAKAAGFAP